MGFGEVKYPAYVTNFHSRLLMGRQVDLDDQHTDPLQSSVAYFSSNLFGYVSGLMAASNPYSSFNVPVTSAYASYAHVGSALDSMSAFVAARNAQSDWQSAFDTAATAADSILMSDVDIEAAIDAEVDVFDLAHRRDLAKAYNRFNSGMHDINAVISSVFPTGRALIEAEYLNNLSDFRTKVSLEKKNMKIKEKLVLIGNAVDSMRGFSAQEGTMRANLYQLKEGYFKLQAATDTDYYRLSIADMIDDRLWYIKLTRTVLDSLGAVSGVSPTPAPQTDLQKLVGGLATTASIATQLMPVSGGAAAAVGGLGILASLAIGNVI